jgi:hypothetical protein
LLFGNVQLAMGKDDSIKWGLSVLVSDEGNGGSAVAVDIVD